MEIVGTNDKDIIPITPDVIINNPTPDPIEPITPDVIDPPDKWV